MKGAWRYLGAVLAAAALAACDDGTATGSTVDVAGLYTACTLAFGPSNTALPAVNLMTQVFASSPKLALDTDRVAQLQYTRKGQIRTEFLDGTYDPGGDVVLVHFPNNATTTSLLLPASKGLDLDVEASSLTLPVLSVNGSVEYTVPRADYARLAGISETGLADQIPGRLTARLAQACS